MTSTEINPDLAAERQKTTFDVTELTTLLDLDEATTKNRKDVEKFFYEDPNIVDWTQLINLSPDEYYKKSLEVAKHFEKKIADHDLANLNMGTNAWVQSTYIRTIAHPSESPLSNHDLLFLPTLKRLASEEQLQKWLTLIQNDKISGCFAQTELGHGSNIQELETTATFDFEKDEFVLHSPALTSIKCWIGGLGRTSNYAIVVAQLLIKGKNYGLHMFVVPLRNLKDGSPLPGIDLGELGPKMGVYGFDNGYLKLNHVRIPRENMLMKNQQVLKDGTYIKPKLERLSYGMMVFVRMGIVWQCAGSLAQAVTIAVRYNCVRRQGKIEKTGPEVKILDYPTQQYKLIPQIALAYGFLFTFLKLGPIYLESISENTAESLNEVHALVSGMKALASHLTSQGIEICRQACGGLGYLHASYLPMLYANTVVACTYEGDITVLRLQTARFLMKSMKIISDGGQPQKTAQYLQKGYFSDYNGKSCLSEVLKMFEVTAANLINLTAQKFYSEVSNGKPFDIAWQENAVELARCSDWHSKYFSILSLHQFLLELNVSKPLLEVLEKLFELLAVYWIKENTGDFIRFGGYAVKVINSVESRIHQLLKDLRPNAVALVDAFDFCDAALHSVIGCYDGRVYERIYDYWSSNNGRKSNQIALQARL